MRIVLQRVQRAGVVIEGKVHASIGKGFMVLLGIEEEDEPGDCAWLSAKVCSMRLFADAGGKMNLDLKQADGDLKGAAADAEHAVALGPEFQSARIALAHLNDRLGQADRSRQIVDRLLKLPPVGDPWWDFKQPTEDADSLEAMRASLRE